MSNRWVYLGLEEGSQFGTCKPCQATGKSEETKKKLSFSWAPGGLYGTGACWWGTKAWVCGGCLLVMCSDQSLLLRGQGRNLPSCWWYKMRWVVVCGIHLFVLSCLHFDEVSINFSQKLQLICKTKQSKTNKKPEAKRIWNV